MGSPTQIPYRGFDSSKIETRYRFEAWREHIRPIVHGKPLRKSHANSIHISRMWAVSDIFVFTFTEDCILCRRTSRHLKETLGLLCIRIYKKGHLRGLLGETFYKTGQGFIHVMDFSQNRHGVDLMNDVEGVLVPQTAVGYDPTYHPASFNIPLESPTGRTLAFAIQSLLQDMPELTGDLTADIRARLVEVLRSVFIDGLWDEAARPALDGARLGAIRQYIDQQLRDPTLGVGHLCQAFNVSRATLFRIFAEVGGIESYIRERRIDHAFRELMLAQPTRGLVGKAAETWCFNSDSHFHRQFMAQYGARPGEVVGSGYVDPQLLPPVRVERPWYRA